MSQAWTRLMLSCTPVTLNCRLTLHCSQTLKRVSLKLPPRALKSLRRPPRALPRVKPLPLLRKQRRPGAVQRNKDHIRSDRHMRIMIVTDQYPPLVGGVPTVTHGLAVDFADRGHQVWVVAPSYGTRDIRRIEHQVRVYRYSSFAWPTYEGLRIPF